jgi:flagellar assembly factor FliW
MNEITVQSAQFGEFSVPATSVFTLPEGIPGFPSMQSAVLVSAVETEGFEGVAVAGSFWWLQSTTESDLAFLCADPWLVDQDYELDFDESVIALDGIEDVMVLCIVNVTADTMTANLRAPLVLNTAAKLAAQVVLSDARWSIKTKVVG